MKTKYSILVIIFFCSISSLWAADKFWQLAWIKYQLERGTNQGDLRNYDWDATVRLELEKSSNEYINSLATNNSILYAPELEDYLQQKLLQIYPEPYWKCRYAVLNKISVVKSSVPDIQVLNNGQILISTGMLYLIDNDDELVALLSQVTAQFVLDLNYYSYKSHKSSGLFSAILGASAYIVSNVALNRKYEDYERNQYFSEAAGDATLLVSGGIFNAIDKANDKVLQMKADSIARSYLVAKNLKVDALSNIMTKIYKYADNHPEYSDVSLLAHYDRYPKRLKNLGYNLKEIEIVHNKNIDYDRNISEALNMNASLLTAGCDYIEANHDLNRITESGYAIEETFLLKVAIVKYTQNSEEANKTILDLLEQAEKVPTSNSESIDIERGLVYYRMNKKFMALDAFLNARKKIESVANYDGEEMSWLNKMIAKCRL